MHALLQPYCQLAVAADTTTGSSGNADDMLAESKACWCSWFADVTLTLSANSAKTYFSHTHATTQALTC